MAQIEYDDEGGLSLYFFAAFWGLILFPVAYFYWPQKPGRVTSTVPCKCKQCGHKNNSLSKLNPGSSIVVWIKKCLFFIGFIIFVVLVVQASKVEKDYADYDPFTILGVDRGATEAEIKRAYRKLTLVHHPDKEGGDEKLFMQITKAHAALTDPEARENWEKYGNPDGPQAATFGIALPSWIVEKKNSVWVLGIYVVCFMVILPTVVSMWWYKSNKTAGDKINMFTVNMYQKNIHDTPAMSLKMVLKVLGSSFEFEKNHNPEMVFRPSDELELKKAQRELVAFQKEKKGSVANKLFSYPHSVKARTLINAQIERCSLPPNSLELDKQYILKKCPMLIQEMINIYIQLLYLHFQRRVPNRVKLVSLENMIRLNQCLIQAVCETKSPLLQLPHLHEGQLKSLQVKKRDIRSLEQLAKLSNKERESVLNFMEQQEYQDLMNVLGLLPVLKLDISIQVIDDKDIDEITAHSIVTVKCNLTRDVFRNVYFSQAIPESKENQGSSDAFSTLELNGTDQPGVVANGSPKKQIQTLKKKPGSKKQTRGGKKRGGVLTVEAGTDDKENATEDNTEADGKDDDENKGEESNDEVPSTSESKKSSKKAEESDTDDELWKENEEPRRAKILDSKPKTSFEVHCPYYPDLRQEGWWVYLCDPKSGTLKSPVEKVSGLKTEETVKLQFNAPDPGTYSYVVHVKSDSYIGLDVEKELKMKVLPAKIIEDHPQWNFSDDEEEKAEEEDVEDEVSDSESGHMTSCSESGDEDSDN